MDALPVEILHQVCELLSPKDVASFRLTAKRNCQVGCYHLVQRVRFHAHVDSLERLKKIADHPIFSQTVWSVVFEGNILANIPSPCLYLSHYNRNDDEEEYPSRPPNDCSDRARRLFERNSMKHQNAVLRKFRKYRPKFLAQRAIITSKTYEYIIETSILSFKRLERIELATNGGCRHVLSQRFTENFPVGCDMPMEGETEHTKKQLQHLLVPTSHIIPSLRELRVHMLSPSFFNVSNNKQMRIAEAFTNLKIVSLYFRFEISDRHHLGNGVESSGMSVASVGMRKALQAAKGLEHLIIHFNEVEYQGSFDEVRHILADSVWPKLRSLDLDQMSASNGALLEALKRQPSLKCLYLSFILLKDELWPEMIQMMRENLNLSSFIASGILEDMEQLYSMDFVDSNCYLEKDLDPSLAFAVECFVTNVVDDEAEGDYNPLLDDAFVNGNELSDTGSMSPSDSYMRESDDDEISSAGACILH